MNIRKITANEIKKLQIDIIRNQECIKLENKGWHALH
jgi:hypothetical protein